MTMTTPTRAAAPAPTKPHRCTIRVDQQTCTQPSAYILRVADCSHVACEGRLWCHGHPACVEHAAKTRAGLYEADGTGVWARQQNVDVEQISNLAAAW